MGMNGGTGFHHKAEKHETVGGHFNSSVNTLSSHLCRLSKQYIADTLKGGDDCFLEKADSFLRRPLIVPTDFGLLPSFVLHRASKVTVTGEM